MHKTGCDMSALYALCAEAAAHRHYNCKKSSQAFGPYVMSLIKATLV